MHAENDASNSPSTTLAIFQRKLMRMAPDGEKNPLFF